MLAALPPFAEMFIAGAMLSRASVRCPRVAIRRLAPDGVGTILTTLGQQWAADALVPLAAESVVSACASWSTSTSALPSGSCRTRDPRRAVLDGGERRGLGATARGARGAGPRGRERAEAAITLPGCKRTRRAGIRNQPCQDRSGRRRAAPREALSRRGPRTRRGQDAAGRAGRMSTATIPDGHVAQRRDVRRLAPAPGLRVFSFNGRTLAHVSAVPLPYVSLGDALARALDSFAGGRTVDAVANEAGLAPGRPQAAFALFVDALERAGVLQDPETPDPIHALRPDGRRTATLFLFPTNRCNLGCVYCYASSGPAGGPPLSEHDAAVAIDRFFDELAPEVAHVSLSFHGGGEPTVALPVMRSTWRRFRERADQLGLRAHGVNDHERRVRQAGPFVPVRARDRDPVQLRRPAPGGPATHRGRP